MKLLLKSTTALVAVTTVAALSAQPSAAADPIEITVGGYMNQWFGYGDNNDNQGDIQNTNVISNTEIFFTGQTTLDNGITFGVNVQLEGNSNTGDQIDESYLFIQGGFGRILLGSENSAGYLMQVSPPDVGIGFNSGDTTNWINNPTGSSLGRTAFGSVNVEPGRVNDSEKITYFTPRFAGLQFGVSYLPGGGQDNALETQSGGFHDGVSTGLNYTQDFGGFNLAASATFGYMSAGNTAVNANPALDDSAMHYTVGANIGVGPISAGVAFAHNFQGDNSATASVEGYGINGGVAYENGPIGVSANVYYGRAEGLVTDPEDDTQLAAGISGSYTLGPGINLVSTIGWAQFDGELGDGPGVSTNNGVYAVGGFALEF